MTYEVAEEKLCARYDANKDMVSARVQEFMGGVKGLSGQWSIDIMQNGDDFWLIDMALAENSLYYSEAVPVDMRHASVEDWIPAFSSLDFYGR